MEQSNSSNPNQTNNLHTSQSQADNTSQQGQQPSKPLKVKGRFTSKTPDPAIPTPDQPFYEQQGQAGGNNGQPPFMNQQPPYYNAEQQQYPQGKLKHGGLGIASFILSLISLLAVVISIILIVASIVDMNEADLLMLQDPAYIESMILNGETMPSFIVSVVVGAFLMMGTALLAFIGFILGVISLFIKQRKKVFGIIGTILNGLLCFGGFIFLVLSFMSALSI